MPIEFPNNKQSASITAQNEWTTAESFAGEFPLRIRGTWSATVTLQRSDDNGTNWDDVSTYTANTVQNVKETSVAGASYRIGVKTGEFTSGTVEVQLG
jgi:hypothetical protein